MPDQDFILQCKNVGLAHRNTFVVHDVDLEVRRGEIFGLIGLNGAGKTTLLRAALGLRPTQRGAIFVNGLDPLSKNARMEVAYLPERFSPPWFLNGYEFIAFTLSLYGQEAKKSAVDAMAEFLALDFAALRRKAQTYSKGMRQKLGLMAVFLTQCGLLILDEPMSGLDPEARERVKARLTAERQQGRAILMTSHILSDMDEICGRVAVLTEGRMIYTGSPAGLRIQQNAPTLEKAFLSAIVKEQAA